jgi:MoxR-like ATPase
MMAVKLSGTFLRALDSCVTAEVPFMIWGAPGVGKSAAVEAIARARGREVVLVIGSTLDPTDLGGIPVPRAGGGVELALPAFGEEILEAYKRTGRKPIVFLDELPEAPPGVRAALLNFLLNGVVARRRVPAIRGAAGNPPEVSITGPPLNPAVANRLVHFEVEPDLEVVAEGFALGFEEFYRHALAPLPPEETVEARMGEVKALVGAFLRAAPHHLLRVPEDPVAQGKAWPSPRSWEMLARVLGASRALGYGREVQALLALGAVGGAGLEFLRYMEELDLPAPEEVLADPERLPSRDDQAYAALMAAVRHALEVPEERWEAAWRVLRFAAERRGQGDLAAMAARVLIRAHRELKARGVVLPLGPEEMGPRIIDLGLMLQARR